jgi:hypothetical protein
MAFDFDAFSRDHLGGEAVPDDLAILLEHADELHELSGIQVGAIPLEVVSDTSYLTPADRANPDIAANIRAMGEINAMVTWVGKTEDNDFIGYWRGPGRTPIATSPLVRLDNEGQYTLMSGRNLAAVIDELVYDDAISAEMAEWLGDLGADEDDDEDDEADESDETAAERPDHALVNDMRGALYEKYLKG